MPRIDEVKDSIVVYLKANGSASMNELVKAVKAGKGTVYNAVSELEEEGVVRTEYNRGRREVILRESIPKYILVYLGSLTLILLLLFAESRNPSIVVFSNKITDPYYPSLFTPIMLILIGYGLGILTFKRDDLVESLHLIKRELKRLTSNVR